MKIQNEIINKLQVLKGIDLSIAYNIFKAKGLDVKQSGFVENLIAFILDRDLPKNEKGMDFKGLFEVKQIKVNILKRSGEMRTGGDTAISAFIRSEVNFFKSNIWDKTKSVLIVCVENDIVMDVRFFDGEVYKEEMESDYNAIRSNGAGSRQSNSILVYKTKRNSIMMKGNTALTMSESIIIEDNTIENQEEYIENLFGCKFCSYQERVKDDGELLISIYSRLNISQLVEQQRILGEMIKNSMGFDMSIGEELCF
jgi:ribosomal protein L23